ncbi:type II toxin-antitoxin system RelE/ParE family toxin [Flagellimonas sediminis]|uniref:Killer suppression protein HigA n=1 Tax=Flagellimonas sediminis TaxID=2696468 RepID=A0A6I5KYM4_9FLAO|nr:killer suppression protein HigA [Allomuricauda sediminis]NDV42060.1 killer suppression protein HigA [Allomuricauda sediminis]
MEISYKTNKLEKQLTNSRELAKTFGQLARKINQRLGELKSAETLAIMRLIPAARCHELSGSNKGELAVDVSPNYRMIFQPNHDPLPKKEDGGLHWESITRIQINLIEDYH